MKIALIGSTGMVGTEMLKVLANSSIFNQASIVPAASIKSVGKQIHFNNKSINVVSIQTALDSNVDIALFSAGGDISKEWAPKFAQKGIPVIDNSSAWRMDENTPLCVPEINSSSITQENKIFANPNCSTIQLVLVLAPLHKKYGIKRLIISTYQSVSGTGYKAIAQMEAERSNSAEVEMAYPHPIDKNCIPHCDVFLENGYTKEEMKLVHETRKILCDKSMKISATAVRVPVDGGHSESVNIEFYKPCNLSEVKELLNQTQGVVVQDDVNNNLYPMPINAKGKDDVFVGRIRKDDSCDNSINLWIVSDNLRKGAATNAVQIAEYLKEQKFI